ncbi:cytochrome c [Kordiimonas sediminis]|uniref:Cytochrome c1 n=1 Tax=Kordiimonas sediminis TaxID=1735581 RepID=A0A919E7B0_9PROT|nr:cytochrome c1 [Kordiimonas sediminis]GHF21077.1 cytochrome c [Kordiimonas sediminis]
MKMIKNIALAAAAVAAFAVGANAAGAAKHPEKVDWQFEGVFGTFDVESAQRGWQVYREVCSACHGLKYFRFRNLDKLGYDEDMIKAFAAEYTVAGEPDDFGDPTERNALPQDAFPNPFPNDNAARASNGGALPPDLSLITKARHDGANYLYSLMTGYEEAPIGVDIPAGKSYNPYFKGGQISMASPLSEGIIEYEDGTAATQEQMAKDVVNFLMYVAEPSLQDRHSLGLNVFLFLLVLTIILYFSMKKIWKPIKAGKNVYEDE